MKHIVMYSGGIGSWMTAKRVIEKHGRDDVIPVAEFDFTDAENPVFASCGVDLTTLQAIFERGEF